MTVTKLVRCRFCAKRAHPLEVVMVLGWQVHEACADEHYRRLAHALGCPADQEGDQG